MLGKFRCFASTLLNTVKEMCTKAITGETLYFIEICYYKTFVIYSTYMLVWLLRVEQ